ncbi:MAG: cell division protein FtsK, partial [Actinobacteria bacterium]|nr:cell division protein FtsK [Actinomycetota bacterium]
MTSEGEGRVITFPGKQTQIDGPKPEPEVIDAELLDEPAAAAAAAVTVDQPHDVIDLLPWHQSDDRRPIIHPAFTREHWGTAWRWYLGRATHITVVHTIRIPYYQGKTLLYAPWGILRVSGRIKDWVGDVETKIIKQLAIRHAEQDLHTAYTMHQGADRQGAPKRRARRICLLILTLLFAGGCVALWYRAPGWVTVLVALGVIDLIGYVGRPADKPMFSPAVVKEQYVKLTSDIVVRGLSSTGIAALASKDAVIMFPSPIQRDGEGWRAEVDLPHGTTPTEVIKVRNKLASGLRRPLGCVWPEGAPDVHEGRLILWVGDKDLAKKGYVRWPLASKGRYDYFSRLPFGEEPRGRLVTLALFEHNMIIGAIPGQGKTGTARCIVCA